MALALDAGTKGRARAPARGPVSGPRPALPPHQCLLTDEVVSGFLSLCNDSPWQEGPRAETLSEGSVSRTAISGNRPFFLPRLVLSGEALTHAHSLPETSLSDEHPLGSRAPPR